MRVGQPEPGRDRESVPNSLTPPPGYTPTLTRSQLERLVESERRKRAIRPTGIGGPLSERSVAMAGLPCPGGWNSETGYNDHGCRCDRCRAAHRERRRDRWQRAKARETVDCYP